MDLQLAPGIVVLNKRYFCRNTLVAAQVGASSFTFAVLRVLLDCNILSAIVLYSRDEQLSTVRCEVEEDWDGVVVVALYFNFRMNKIRIATSLRDAFRLASSKRDKQPHPIVYYQTDTLLHYHPQGYHFCVTHHGPFASHFAQEFSPDLARLSFGGAQDKADILCRRQQLGIQRLLQDNQGHVLAHSRLQQRILENAGLHSTRFTYLHPPIGVPLCNDPIILPKAMQDFIYGTSLLLLTAVARLDYFKNVELLVQSGLELLEMGVTVRTLVVGDPEDDSSRRRALLESVPAEKRSLFMVYPRLAKGQLYALFAAARQNGVFICPSRYETLGITPLEAAASGVTTLVTETPNVEALTFMPAACRVPQDKSCIAAKVKAIYLEGVPVWAKTVKRHVRPATSLEGFRDDLLTAWAEMSGASILNTTRQADTQGDQSVRNTKLAVL
ncbi:hypothetical protein J7T55_006965 [Diaporthe amygdali]|uniref:uncharacterized protein n=1 Tax=Phomopsis amygdali TaxID=1214568 RepID=UPI0022FF308D|nr:uncharacterized protein J7T55_006965 [Diaporthe amygdali]KAJ0107085.1 hypothetical protein J7T55_006965 [Diaporthe amygdali]